MHERQLTAELSEVALIADPTRRQEWVSALLDELHRVRADISPRQAGAPAKPKTDLARVQRQVLDAESLLLVYALGVRRSVLWAITGSTFETFALPARAAIEGLARDWLAEFRTPGKSGRAVEARFGDEFAAVLMDAFYRGYLREGLPAAEILRQAQLGLASDPDNADPYSWAGFFCQGDRRVW